MTPYFLDTKVRIIFHLAKIIFIISWKMCIFAVEFERRQYADQDSKQEPPPAAEVRDGAVGGDGSQGVPARWIDDAETDAKRAREDGPLHGVAGGLRGAGAAWPSRRASRCSTAPAPSMPTTAARYASSSSTSRKKTSSSTMASVLPRWSSPDTSRLKSFRWRSCRTQRGAWADSDIQEKIDS